MSRVPTSGGIAATRRYGDYDTNPDAWPEPLGWCCGAAAMQGPECCTCWQPTYDLEQLPPIRPRLWPGQRETRPSPCDDCAYRPDSPERSDDYDRELIETLTYGEVPFYCHDGMRRPVTLTHPEAKVTLDGDPADYQPPIVDGVPYRADGRPGLICAGWAARKESHDRTRPE